MVDYNKILITFAQIVFLIFAIIGFYSSFIILDNHFSDKVTSVFGLVIIICFIISVFVLVIDKIDKNA